MKAVPVSQRLVMAAMEAFGERGFNATTTRDIATRAGVSPAAVYVHYESKETLLFAVSTLGHTRALQTVVDAAAVTDEPTARLWSVVYQFALWHALNSKLARVCQYESRSLSSEHRAEIAVYRRKIERIVYEVLEDGVKKAQFELDNIAGTTLALLSLGIDLSRWFSPGGPRSGQDLAEFYAALAVRLSSKNTMERVAADPSPAGYVAQFVSKSS